MTDKDLKLIMKWLEPRELLWAKTKTFFYVLWLRLRQFASGRHFTIGMIGRNLMRLFLIGAIASSGFWVDYFIKATIKYDKALLFSGILSLCMIFLWLIDKISARSKAGTQAQDHQNHLASANVELVGRIRALGNLRGSKKPLISDDGSLHMLRKDVLQCIKQQTKCTIADYDDTQVHCSLLTFDGTSTDEIRLDAHARNPPFNMLAEGLIVSAKETIAYYVMESRHHKILHDTKRSHPYPDTAFKIDPREYRSVLFVPIVDYDKKDNEYRIPGCLLIFAKKQYYFLRKSELLIRQIRPYVSWLTLILKNHRAYLKGRDAI